PVGWRGLVEKDQAASVPALELGPPGAARVVALVEEGPCEERRTLLVVANDKPVFGRSAETEHQWRQAAIDRLFGAVEDQCPHLIVVRRGLGIESNARRTRRSREGRVVAWRGRKGLQLHFVDGSRSRR